MLPDLALRYESLLRRAFPGKHFLAEDALFPPMPEDTPELVWQSRWFAGDFGRDFTGTAGERIRIAQFGRWNHGPGPDFHDCAVEIDGELRRGCIELDRMDRDWERHGHSVNPSYQAVVLHVFLRAGSDRFFTRTASHASVPQARLAWEEILPAPAVAQPAAKPGRCQRLLLSHWEEARCARLLEAAARYRLERKARLHGPEEAHFQCLAECLGYRNNKLPMLALAQQFPLKSLRKHPDQAEAWLFGAAGFLDEVSFDESDPPTRAYLRGLWETWWKRRAAWKESLREKSLTLPWKTGSARPANHPQRRVAALAKLAAAWGELGPLLQPGDFAEKKITALLCGLRHPYWDHHYTLTSLPCEESLAILGKSRAVEMLANAIYPALVSQREALWARYLQLTAQLPNEKTQLAALRLFGPGPQAKSYQKRVFHQQGLLQIYEDVCLVDASDCEGCPFPEQIVEEF